MPETDHQNKSIQHMIIWSFIALLVVGMSFVGVILYQVFDKRTRESVKVNSSELLQQAATNLEDYIHNMQGIQDSIGIMLKDNENVTEFEIRSALRLLYGANKDNLVSIAIYKENGELIASVPYSMQKKTIDIKKEDWFVKALRLPEGSYIDKPHVQNQFDINGFKYFWVVSLSNTVNITQNGKKQRCVIVVDMNYSSIGKVFRELNQEGSANYTYLMDRSGNLIYHPNANLISSGLFQENEKNALGRADGSWEETFAGKRRIVSMQTLDYTSWKIVRVTSEKSVSLGMQETRYLMVIIVIIAIIILIFSSMLMSDHITKPLENLTDSIRFLDEDGLPDDIYVGGSYEVEYLGKTLRDFVDRLRKLMDDIVEQQEQKRKTELDALQSQINPHFLYNTLDSIVWMIEGERYQEAIFMIRELASLFRISLSKGKTMIPIEDELKHAANYMNIQKVRYRNRFEIEYDIDPEIRKCVTVKLVLQPILENALYYAVEALDGEGEILVKGFRKGDDIYLQVIDNGMGMTQEMVDGLLLKGNHVPKHGSGVGLRNIHERLQIRFGKQYGLQIHSELDEGTTVTLHLPYQLYEKGE